MSLIILFVEVDGNCELIASPKLFLSALIVFNDLSLSKIIVILITERNRQGWVFWRKLFCLLKNLWQLYLLSCLEPTVFFFLPMFSKNM